MTMAAPYKSTAVFDSETLPAALRKAHRTKAGVWGVVNVLEGRLRLSFADGREEMLSHDRPGLLLPDELHWVTPLGAMRMRVDFYDVPPDIAPHAAATPARRFGRAELNDIALKRFRRLMGYIVIAGVATMILALAYLAANDALNTVSAIATSLGVFLSVVLGGGLMAIGFLSSNSGHDDQATGKGH